MYLPIYPNAPVTTCASPLYGRRHRLKWSVALICFKSGPGWIRTSDQAIMSRLL